MNGPFGHCSNQPSTNRARWKPDFKSLGLWVTEVNRGGPCSLSSLYSQTCLQSLCRTDCEQRITVFSTGSSSLVRTDPDALLLCYVYRLLSHRVNRHVNMCVRTRAHTHTSNCLQTHFTTKCVCERERQRGGERVKHMEKGTEEERARSTRAAFSEYN